jgi:hypothetical protein
MSIGPLRITQAQFEKHVVGYGKRLAEAAGLGPHRIQLTYDNTPNAEGDLQVKLQRSSHSVLAINQRQVREHTVIFWRCPGTKDSMTFGYSENWQTEAKHVRLIGAGIRFFYRASLDGESQSPVQLLRFEWADAQLGPAANAFAFPAKGAATPHWHYDGLETDRVIQELARLRNLFCQPAPRVSDVKEFSELETKEEPEVQGTLIEWFGQIHLAARASWHLTPLPNVDFMTMSLNPHANSPLSLTELQNTMGSAIMYMRHQLVECRRSRG